LLKDPSILNLEIVKHWERGLIISKDDKGAIERIVERKTKFTLVNKLKSKKPMELAK
jgi:IS30 family transposase